MRNPLKNERHKTASILQKKSLRKLTALKIKPFINEQHEKLIHLNFKKEILLKMNDTKLLHFLKEIFMKNNHTKKRNP